MNLNDLQYFVAAVDAGGFAAASRRLGVPKSTLSKRVAALEEDLSVRLILRTSRSFRLTELGREFHTHARAALIEAETAEALVRSRQAEPSGTVRLTCAIPTAQELLTDCLPRLARAHPRLQLQLEVTDRFVDVVEEGFDIALRCHRAPLPDSGLIQRLLLREAFIPVASAAYLEQAPPLHHPQDLVAHRGLLIGPTASNWELQGPEGEVCRVAPIPALVANESQVLLAAAIAGLGVVAGLTEGMCRAALASGDLVRVLPDWQAGSIATSLVMPHRRGLLPGVRAVADFLAASVVER